MIYLMSDVHGWSSLFFEMLEKIRFGDSDRMYILGDLVAKGPDSLGLLRYVMDDGRIRLLRGNHEQRLLQACGADSGAAISREVLQEWEREDGGRLLRQLAEIPAGEKGRILEFLKNTPLYERNRWGGRDWLLVHGAPEPGMGYGILENRFPGIGPDGERDRTGTRQEAEEGLVTVVGHTPTFKYGKQYAGRIIVGKERIFLDCGAGWGYGLGCLRLEDGKEFYCRPLTNGSRADIISL